MATPKQRRAVAKGKLTRFETFLDEETNNPRKINKIQNRVDNLESVYRDFEDTYLEDVYIDDETTDQSAAETVAREARLAVIAEAEREMAEFENKYYTLISRAQELLSRDGMAGISERVTRISTATPELSAQFQAKVKLPQLSIPRFSGEYVQWQTFHDTFVSLIHDEATLSRVQKFHYLQRALVGNAAKIIERIQPTDGNYTVAWELLKTRCGNKKAIIKTHIKNILELPTMAKQAGNALGDFVDTLENNTKALANLEVPVDKWDAILLYILVEKLDPLTKERWETLKHKEEAPSVQAFIEFLRERCGILESLVRTGTKTEASRFNDKERRAQSHLVTRGSRCIYCQGNHPIYWCDKFKRLSVTSRRNEATQRRLCFNCLKDDHMVQNCKSSTCRICKRRHNTLLHREENDSNSEGDNNPKQTAQIVTAGVVDEPLLGGSQAIKTASAMASTTGYDRKETVLLSTAVVNILDYKGTVIKCRALLDSGSQSSFMTTKLFNKLRLEFHEVNIPVSGINAVKANAITKIARTTIRSAQSNYETSILFLVMNKITDNIPQNRICREELPLPKHLKLADPNFHQVGTIDLLLGVNVFYDLLLQKQLRLGEEKVLILQESKLGWIVAGTWAGRYQGISSMCSLGDANEQDIHKQLEAFWQVEEIVDGKRTRWTTEEAACEKHFIDTFKRDTNGRFIVALPLRDNVDALGESKEIAMQRFQALEHRLKRDKDLRQAYTRFMDEYLELGHMSQIDHAEHSASREAPTHCYVPHHCVRKEDSLTTKLRVVFDASAKTSSGVSLNEVLMVGPSIQSDIFSILLRFRMHKVVYTADIEKVYRQILVNDDQTNLQRIVWRKEPSERLCHYKLNTVTYGTGPASFLATRCLQQLGLENQQAYPKASQAIMSDFYMDDFISGSTDKDTAKEVIEQVDKILRASGFVLRQWASNDNELVPGVELSQLNAQYAIKDDNAKTLGVYWRAADDDWRYKIKHKPPDRITKCVMLSVIAQIFDPLGLVGPVIVRAKMLLQRLWQCKIYWDDEVPKLVLKEWHQLVDNLSALENLRVERHVLVSNPTSIVLHCFCDASQLAYGACVYLTSTNATQILSRLVTSKSRVAPLKVISLPRLELCAAALAAELYSQVRKALNFSVGTVYFWSDSTIVLAWLSSEPNLFKTFIANRVSRIQSLTKGGSWKHVPTAMNPADIISRGLNPEQLMDSNLWWDGPRFLRQSEEFWPTLVIGSTESLPETKPKKVICYKTITYTNLIDKHSSFTRLLRVVAYVYQQRSRAVR